MFEGSFSVGATAINDTIAFFSSRGPVAVDSSFRTKPNVSAPGVGIRSARPGGFYGNASGTSMAGPHVAGLVALIISANPNLAGEVDIIENIIEQTSVPKTTDQNCGSIPGSQVPNNTFGYGRIDALAAVEAAIDLIPVSIENAQNPLLVKVYPNPVFDQMIIEIQEPVHHVSVEIFDVHGRNVWRNQEKSGGLIVMKINLQNQPSGIYFYQISTGKEITQGKVIKSQLN